MNSISTVFEILIEMRPEAKKNQNTVYNDCTVLTFSLQISRTNCFIKNFWNIYITYSVVTSYIETFEIILLNLSIDHVSIQTYFHLTF